MFMKQTIDGRTVVDMVSQLEYDTVYAARGWVSATQSEYDTFVGATILDDYPITKAQLDDALAAFTPSSATSASLPNNFVTKTAVYTAAANDFVLADATSGPFTVTLPTNPAAGALVSVKKTDAIANSVTVSPAGGGTIDGQSSALITSQNFGGTFEHKGSNVWHTAATPTSQQGPAGATGATGAAGTNGSNGTPFPFVWVAGQYYAPMVTGSYSAGVAGATYPGLNQGIYTPHQAPPGGGHVDRVGLLIDAAGGATSVLRIGLYNDDGTGKPGSLILDCGTIDSSTTGYKEVTISSTAVPAGLFWVLSLPGVANSPAGPRRLSSSGDPYFPRSSGTNGASGGVGGYVTAAAQGSIASTASIGTGNPTFLPVTTVRAA